MRTPWLGTKLGGGGGPAESRRGITGGVGGRYCGEAPA